MKRDHTIILGAMFAAAMATPAIAGETIHIGIGTQDTTINTVHAGLIVRELKLLEKYLPRTGKYADVTYDVVWKNFTSGPPLNGEMLAGKLDIGSLGDFPSILNGVSFTKQGNRSVYVAALSGNASGGGNGLVVPADSPVQSLRELKGKSISVPFGSAAHGMLLRAIRDLGWDPERDVSLVSQSPEVGGSALKAHKIDAHADFVPFAELFPFRGYARKIYDGSTVGVPTSHGVVARGEFADRYPELVVAFLKAVIEADRLLAADPERYAELVHKVAGVDAEVVYMFHGPGGIQTRDLTIKPAVRKSLAVAFETLTLLKRADGKLDLNSWIDDRFIRQAAKESGIDYDARLRAEAPVGVKPAGEIWVSGEPKVRRQPGAAATLAALVTLEREGKKPRAVFLHDEDTGLKLLADKAWLVLEGKNAGKEAAAKGPRAAALPRVAAFLTREAADRWAKKQGGRVVGFDEAKGAVVASAEDGATTAGARAALR